MIHIISFFAFFTILSHIGVVFEWSFQTLASLSFIPLLCSIALYYFFRVKKLSLVEEYAPELNKNKLDYIYVLLASIIAIGLCLFVYMSDSDESFYASIENHAIYNPQLPYLKYDGMFGEEGKLLLHVSYKAQSYQMLSAVTSYLFNIPNLLPRHIFFPIIFTILFLISWTKLFKLFLPDKWQLALLILTMYGTIDGSFRGVSLFSYTRFFDGKCVLFYVMMPLIFYYTILFFRKPSAINWFYLVIIQIAGVGLSASAVYLFPFQLLVLGLCYFKLEITQTKKIILYGTSGFYLLLVGIVLKLIIYSDAENHSLTVLSNASQDSYLSTVLKDLWLHGGIFGHKLTLIINCIAICLVWRFYPKNSDLRNLLIALPILVILVLLNPAFFNLISSITTKYTYHRLGFILMIPLFFVILVVHLIRKQEQNTKKINNGLFVIVIFSIMSYPFFFNIHLYFKEYYEIFREDFFKPRLQKNIKPVASFIFKNNPENTAVLATEPVSFYISTSPKEKKPKLVAVKSFHIDKVIKETFSFKQMMQHSFSREEIKMGNYLHLTVNGYQRIFDAHKFINYLSGLNVGTVISNINITNHSKLAKALQKAGYSKKALFQIYEVWIKDDINK